MKVLLCTDIEKLGWLGDVVDVKDGYARNYLLPQGLATVANRANIKALADEKVKRAQERQLATEKLEQVAKSVESAEAVVAAKANEQGHLFGSVSKKEIAQNLRDQGFEVPDSVVRLAEHIKEVGTHEVTLKFTPDLAVNITVIVVSQDEAIESIDKDKE